MNISVVKYPHAHPGKCMHCGNASAQDGRLFVDMGHQIPRYGAVYFCEHCVKELGRLFGLVNKADLNKAEEDIKNLQMIHQALREENDRLRDILAGIDLLGVLQPTPDVPDAQANSPAPSEPKSASNRRTTRATKTKPETDDGSDESSSSAGSSRVSGDDLAAQLRAERRLSY